jgi:KDO2-lipid IV(A) lauroyltransferase
MHVVAWIAYHLDTKHRRIAKANLDFAFGATKSDEEKERIIKASYVNLAYNIYEFIVLQHETVEQMQTKMHVENDEVVRKLLEEGKPVIMVSGHYGCWEFALPYFSIVYNPLTIISRKLNNRYINEVFVKARHRQKLSMCEKEGAVRCVVRSLKNGKVVAITIDQNLDPKQSVTVDFFGHKVAQVDSPVRLASKMGAAIVPIMNITEGFENYRMIIHDPIEVPKNISEEEVVTYSQKLSDILEAQIRSEPEHWFWQHRRWKLYYPEIYRK